MLTQRRWIRAQDRREREGRRPRVEAREPQEVIARLVRPHGHRQELVDEGPDAHLSLEVPAPCPDDTVAIERERMQARGDGHDAESPGTWIGVLRFVVVPIPSWPWSFCPQAQTFRPP
jgi:hypothetical protein